MITREDINIDKDNAKKLLKKIKEKEIGKVFKSIPHHTIPKTWIIKEI